MKRQDTGSGTRVERGGGALAAVRRFRGRLASGASPAGGREWCRGFVFPNPLPGPGEPDPEMRPNGTIEPTGRRYNGDPTGAWGQYPAITGDGN